jgi:hypothetical protein
MKRISLSILVVLALALLISAYSSLAQQGAQVGQTATQALPTQPVKAKKILVRELPKALKGITLENGVFKLQSGYKFVSQPNKTIAVGLQAGGDIGGSFNCFCPAEERGSCSVSTIANSIFCNKGKTKPCKEACELSIDIDGIKTKLAIF